MVEGFPGGASGKETACLPTQETLEIQAQSLGWEDPLEEDMGTHFSVLSWRIPWIERSLTSCSPWGCKESDMSEMT